MGDGKRKWERKEIYVAKAVKKNPLLNRNAIVMVSVNRANPNRKASGAMTVRR